MQIYSSLIVKTSKFKIKKIKYLKMNTEEDNQIMNSSPDNNTFNALGDLTNYSDSNLYKSGESKQGEDFLGATNYKIFD